MIDRAAKTWLQDDGWRFVNDGDILGSTNIQIYGATSMPTEYLKDERKKAFSFKLKKNHLEFVRHLWNLVRHDKNRAFWQQILKVGLA